MNVEILKETSVEYIQNLYALSITYLKNNNSLELKNLIKELDLLESKIRESNKLDDINNYKVILNQLSNRVEEIVNE